MSDSNQVANSTGELVAWSVDPSIGSIVAIFLVVVFHVMVVINRMARVVSAIFTKVRLTLNP